MRGRNVVLTLAVSFAVAATVTASQGHTRTSAVTPCTPDVRSGVLPVWMRAGFSKNPRIPYVLGMNRLVGGVLFGNPLRSPPAAGRSNKILWVPRRYSKTVAALWIRMQQMDGTHMVGAPVRKIIANGPGPSIIDVPSPGCWRFTLSWSGTRDTLDLTYLP